MIVEKEEDSTVFTEDTIANEQEKETNLVMKTLYPKLFPDDEGS